MSVRPNSPGIFRGSPETLIGHLAETLRVLLRLVGPCTAYRAVTALQGILSMSVWMPFYITPWDIKTAIVNCSLFAAVSFSSQGFESSSLQFRIAGIAVH